MKTILSKLNIAIVIATVTSFSSCSKFDEINTNPTQANENQVQVEYFLNNSIIGAQQDPHIAERVFVLYWKSAGRQHLSGGITSGGYNDDWSNDYWRYISEWLNHANTAIQIADMKAENGSAMPYNENLKQVARIWRAYLMSELSDNFGAIPTEAFTGSNPEFKSTKDVYYFLLDELKDASSKIDAAITRPDVLQNQDPAYRYDWDKWIRYGNSMRLRLAMRIAEVDAAKAKAEFEDAVATNKLITTTDHTFKVAERPGWDALSGVMSREWNGQVLSTTLNNIYVGLGGVKSEDQLDEKFHSAIKPENYIGKKMLGHYSTRTNDPTAGYFFDGLPNTIDPRAYKTFYIPGDVDGPTWSNYPSWASDASVTQVRFPKVTGFNADTLDIDVKYTWSTAVSGDFGAKGSVNPIRSIQVGKIPGLSKAYRTSNALRIFFAHWETYFLLAEASLKGWNTGTTAQAAYENGVKANFEYHGVSAYATEYLNSESYNRVGTSVKFTHTTEPGTSRTMNFVDGYTGTAGTTPILYPVNTIYMNGTVKNDALTKIITQKYIANMPWLPLEAWSDHRRLGLPFFENPAVENPLPNLPALTSSNYMTNQIKFFPQRLRYPSSLRNADQAGYDQAVSYLGGPDEVLTPLWWAKQN